MKQVFDRFMKNPKTTAAAIAALVVAGRSLVFNFQEVIGNEAHLSLFLLGIFTSIGVLFGKDQGTDVAVPPSEIQPGDKVVVEPAKE